MSQIVVPGGGLASVSTDTSLTGDGTSVNPLSVVDPGWLTAVSTDATLTGDGTSGNPLSVAGGGGGTYSVAKTVFSNGGLPPLTAPQTVYVTCDGTWYTPAITSADVSFATGDIVFNNTGTYRITLQLTFSKVPVPSPQDLEIKFGIGGAFPNPLTSENYTFQHFDSNGGGTFSAEFSTVINAVAGGFVKPQFEFGGTGGASANYVIGAEAGFIIVERVA